MCDALQLAAQINVYQIAVIRSRPLFALLRCESEAIGGNTRAMKIKAFHLFNLLILLL